MSNTPTAQDMRSAILEVCNDMAEFLAEKNAAYGNSVADPVGIFAKGLTAEQQIMVRIDDKLSRLARGSEYPGDDTIKDLAGYLIILMAMRELESGNER